MTIQEFASALFEIRINGHIAHLQTTSFAKHKALDELYTGIVDLTDSYIETYQGISGIIKNYPQIQLRELPDIKEYLTVKVTQFRAYRLTVKETELQQKIDDILEFLDTIIYKLRFLA
jgi:Family of unknown function (DUF5856)